MSISFVLLGSEAEGVAPSLLIDIGGSSGSQYMVRCPDAFSRLALEHKVRPTGRLRAVFAPSPDAPSLGGLGGLLLRLRQDGHAEVEVVGPRGAAGHVTGLARILQWRHPRVLVSEADPSAPDQVVYADPCVEVAAVMGGGGGEGWRGPYWLRPSFAALNETSSSDATSSTDSSSASDSSSSSGDSDSDSDDRGKQKSYPCTGIRKRKLTLADGLDDRPPGPDPAPAPASAPSRPAHDPEAAFSALDQIFMTSGGRTGHGLKKRILGTLGGKPGAGPSTAPAPARGGPLHQPAPPPLPRPPAPSVPITYGPEPARRTDIPAALSSYDHVTHRPLCNLFARTRPSGPVSGDPPSFLALVFCVKSTGQLLLVVQEDGSASAAQRLALHPGFEAIARAAPRVAAIVRLPSAAPSQPAWDRFWAEQKSRFPTTAIITAGGAPSAMGFVCSGRAMAQLAAVEPEIFLCPRGAHDPDATSSRPADTLPTLADGNGEGTAPPEPVDPSAPYILGLLDRVEVSGGGPTFACLVRRHRTTREDLAYLARPGPEERGEDVVAELGHYKTQRAFLIEAAASAPLLHPPSAPAPALLPVMTPYGLAMVPRAVLQPVMLHQPRPPPEPPAKPLLANPEEIDLDAVEWPAPSQSQLSSEVTAALKHEASLSTTRAILSAPAASLPRVLFLGTGSAEPSVYRASSGILLTISEGGATALLDCGEGTWPQLVRCLGLEGAADALRRLRLVWLSHHHADHVCGCLTVLEQAQRARAGGVPGSSRPPLSLLGPSEVVHWLRDALASQGPGLDRWLRLAPFPRALMEGPAVMEALGLARFESVPVQHSREAHALVLEHRSGWKLAYSGDCRPSPSFARAAQNATLLIHEATFEGCLGERAAARRHSTTAEALDMARQIGAYRTVLTHFSQRYRRLPEDVPTACWPLAARPLVAFDGMSVAFAQLPWMPLVQPVVAAALKKPLEGGGAENGQGGAEGVAEGEGALDVDSD